ncbi:MAG: hypothetical protein Q8P90_00590 [bacterium]|nr:hypothetical protein [bacterium]
MGYKIKSFGFKNGYTSIEIFLVVGVLVLLGAVAFIAINPEQKIDLAQDETRREDAYALLNAFFDYSEKHEGAYIPGVQANGDVHMIATQTSPDCIINSCNVDYCTDFSALISEGFLVTMPFDPDGSGLYSPAVGATGYTLSVSRNGNVTVVACGAEEDIISIKR